MLNTEQVFTDLELGNSAVLAVRGIREEIEKNDYPSLQASYLIKAILGVEREYEDANVARTVAMKIGEEAFKANHQIEDVDSFFDQCEKYAIERVNNPANAYIYAVKEEDKVEVNTVQVVAEVNVKVAVKANGKIKKGGKQVLADELYKMYVLEADTASTNQEFIAILMSKLDMSKPGATTYAYNCKKKLGEPEGGIVKAKKGRKAKVVA